MFVLACGLLGAATASQLPEFSQQYVQRLGGTVDALAEVVAEFDKSAAAEGLTRAAALDAMQGSGFVDRRQDDMAETFTRHARLDAQYRQMQAAGPFMRSYYLTNPDVATARAAMSDFQPAVPLTPAGAVFAGTGFGLGALLAAVVVGVFRPARRRRRV
jgi:hypothetical protein